MQNKVLITVVSVVEVEVDESLPQHVNNEFAKEFVLDNTGLIVSDNCIKHLENYYSAYNIGEVTKGNFLDDLKQKLAVENMPKI